MAVVWVVIFDRLCEVDVAGDMRPLVPALEKPFKDEGGFADAAGTVEDEWLMDAVAVSVVVEDSFHDWSWYDPPCFVHHLST